MTDTVTPDTVTTDLEAQIGAYADNLVITGLHALEAVTISLGRTLGLYDRLVELGEATPPTSPVRRHPPSLRAGMAGAAGRRGVHRRRRRRARRSGSEPHLRLSTAAAACLTDPDSLASVGPLFDLLPSVGTVLPALHTAFRTGGGVPTRTARSTTRRATSTDPRS